MTDIIEIPAPESRIALRPAASETPEMAVARAIANYKAINSMVERTFKLGVHYADRQSGKKPGEKGYKPVLELPGIELAMNLFGLREEYYEIHVIRDTTPDNPFFYFEMGCRLVSLTDGTEIGNGEGICHSREKSLQRQAFRECPKCEKAAIIRSKFPPRNAPAGTEPGWYCNPKSDGCGANFDYKDNSITGQEVGNIYDTQLIWDSVNAIKKKANKRALAAVVKRVAMLSEHFTVDIEDDLRFTDAEISGATTSGTQPGNVTTVDFTPTPTTAGQPTPPPTETTTTVASHWSKDPEKIKLLVQTMQDNGIIEKNQGAADLLKLLGKDSFDGYATGQIASKAIQAAVDALKKSADKPNPFASMQTGTASSRRITYKDKHIIFHLDTDKKTDPTAIWFPGRTKLDEMLNITAYKFAELTADDDYDLPFAMQVTWQDKANKQTGKPYSEVTAVTADQNNIDAWLTASKPAPQPERVKSEDVPVGADGINF